MTTRKKLVEQVRYALEGDPSVGDSAQDEDIREAIGQVINTVFKADFLGATTLASGETIPEGSMILTYDTDNVVYPYKGKARCKLPAIPIALPKNMGIWHVGSVDDIDCQYIPMQPGQGFLLKGQKLISDLFGQIAYEPDGAYILFNKDITATDGVTEVLIKLIVMDINKLSDWDILPIPADMENLVFTETLKIFGVQQPPDKTVDSGAGALKTSK